MTFFVDTGIVSPTLCIATAKYKIKKKTQKEEEEEKNRFVLFGFFFKLD